MRSLFLARRLGYSAVLSFSMAPQVPGKALFCGDSRDGTDCVYLETDRLHYWEIEAEPGILNVALDFLMHADVEVKKSTELVGSIEQSRRKPQKPPRHGTLVELLKACLGRDAVIATFGNLLPPHADNGFYRLLGQCTNKTMLHVLVAQDNAVLARRIQARGLEAKLGRIIASNNWRLRNRTSYDLVLTGTEPTAGIMEMIRLSIAEKERAVGADDCPDHPTET